MKRLSLALVVTLVLVVSATSALAYVSDRHDFGEIDFKGATVTFVAHFDNLTAFYEGGAHAGRLEEAKKLFNIGEIKMVATDWGSVGELALNRYLSGDSQYDIWRLPHHVFFQLATRGAFFPVNTILPEEYFEHLSPITQHKNLMLAQKGELYHFSAGVPDDYGHMVFAVVNLDIFENENLGDPFDLYHNGEWTFAKVEEIMSKVTRDTDGDGVIDQWGIITPDPVNLIYANGGAITRIDEDGKIVFTMNEPETIEALRIFNEWFEVQGYGVGGHEMIEWKNGQTAMAFMPFWQINPNEYDFSYAVLPLPMGPNTDEYIFSPGVADALFIPQNSAYPEGLIALDNFLFPLDEYWEGLDEAIAVRVLDRESFGIMLDSVEYADRDAAYYHNFLGGRWDGGTPYADIVSGVLDGRPPATVVNEHVQQAQAMIDEVLNQ